MIGILTSTSDLSTTDEGDMIPRHEVAAALRYNTGYYDRDPAGERHLREDRGSAAAASVRTRRYEPARR